MGHGERPIVLTNEHNALRSTQELHAAWLEERNRGLFDWLWASVSRRRRRGRELLAERRLAELPDPGLRDLVDELKGVR
jgi:hypothetical protein